MSNIDDIIIGIDLGTSNSVLAIYENNKVTVIPNENGSYLTKSRVLVTEHGLVVTDEEINNSIEILEVKRLMGLSKLSEIVDKDHIFFKVTEDDNGLLIENKYRPEEISAEILKYMKKTAENYLNREVTKAVVTVPAYFNDAARTATKNACILALLEPVRIINEPTSAALAYHNSKEIKEKEKENKDILVFDLGGGTFDLSLLNIDESNDFNLFKVIATAGTTTLGGSNFDNELFSYCMKQINEENEEKISISKRSLKKLKKECISAKIALSNSLKTTIFIEEFLKDVDLSINITRSSFEQMCIKYFNECILLMSSVLKDSSKNKNHISEVILIGGSTRIPKIKEMLKNYFKDSSCIINDTIDPDQAVAYGAAIQGAMINGLLDKNLLLDIVPMNLGLELSDGILSVLIKRNTTIPVSVSKIFTTDISCQKGLTIKVYEGLRVMAIDNHKIGSFNLDLFYNEKEPNDTHIEITFSIDYNGLLEITARDLDLSYNNKITVTLQNLNDTDKIKNILEDFKENAYYDSIIIKNKKAQDKLICYCQELLVEFKENKIIYYKIKQIYDWSLKENYEDYLVYDKKSAEIYYLIKDL